MVDEVKRGEEQLEIDRNKIKSSQHQNYHGLEQFWRKQARQLETKKRELLATKQIKE